MFTNHIYLMYCFMQHQETVAMTSMDESKCIFKSQTALKLQMNERPM